MRTVFLAAPDDFEGWRDAARALALARVPPEDLLWQAGDAPTDLFGDEAVIDTPATVADGAGFTVPRAFVSLARDAICHRDPERFALLYTLLTRLRDQPRLIDDQADPLLRRVEELAKAVRRDVHKMRAFLRFREVDDGGHVRFVAWFEPEHHIVRVNAGFFVRRFATMRWSILTPELSIHWDSEKVTEAPGATKADAPEGDPIEETWKTYYASIFNPARVKIGAMLKEMPKKYWKNMPETALVPGLIAGAQARESGMIAHSENKLARQEEQMMARPGKDEAGGAAIQPDLLAPAPREAIGGNSLAAWQALRAEALACTRCHLHEHATQTVFGEGPVDARLMFVGEQPGDQEDLAGKPFVGPAGQLFDKALTAAGVDRGTVYVTNAVKHFKFEQRGKRRIHAKPQGPEIEACRWWIEQERTLIRPPLTVALGATAARSLLGKVVTISGARGHPHILADGGEAWVTVHPSYLLRIPDRAKADEEYARFVEDLRAAGERAKAMAG